MRDRIFALIGWPGSLHGPHFPQFYSRVGFVHELRPQDT